MTAQWAEKMGSQAHIRTSFAVLAFILQGARWKRRERISGGSLRDSMRKFIAILVAVTGLALAGCASVPGGTNDPDDPFESMNRSLFEASLATDKYVTLPAAKFYRQVVPKGVRVTIRNFLNNLRTPVI